MSDIERHTISINDIRYSLGPCGNCGQSASEAEALQALSEWREWLGDLPSCAICGTAIPMTEVVLVHRVVSESPEVLAWRINHVIFGACLGFVAVKGVDVKMHESCARKALPRADWESLGDVRHHQEGQRRMPWDTGFHERTCGTQFGFRP